MSPLGAARSRTRPRRRSRPVPCRRTSAAAAATGRAARSSQGWRWRWRRSYRSSHAVTVLRQAQGAMGTDSTRLHPACRNETPTHAWLLLALVPAGRRTSRSRGPAGTAGTAGRRSAGSGRRRSARPGWSARSAQVELDRLREPREVVDAQHEVVSPLTRARTRARSGWSAPSSSNVPMPKTGCCLRTRIILRVQFSSELALRICASTLIAW